MKKGISVKKSGFLFLFIVKILGAPKGARIVRRLGFAMQSLFGAFLMKKNNSLYSLQFTNSLILKKKKKKASIISPLTRFTISDSPNFYFLQKFAIVALHAINCERR